MTKPDYLKTLIDKASEQAGNDAKLAKLLHQSRANVSMWRTGSRPCPVEDQIIMASIAGLDAQAWSARALIAKHEGTPKGEALFKALGKSLTAIGAASVSFGAKAGEIAAAGVQTICESVAYLIRCINCQVSKDQFQRWFRLRHMA